MNKPNIFSIATKELSQDAFITWLIQWADKSCCEYDEQLNEIGRKFISFLLDGKISIDENLINHVEAGRQWDNIDIWADIDEKYFLIIEDKTNTNEHDNQLKRYEKIVKDYYKASREIVCVYLKTGIESLQNKRNIENKNWKYISRSSFLTFLNGNTSNSEIYNEYVENLNKMDAASSCFTQYSKLNSWEATKGLYLWLQNQLNENTHWDHVPNASGGFLGFWFHFCDCKKNSKRKFYLQIENYCNNKVNLFIKLCGEWNEKVSYLYDRLSFLKDNMKDYDLTVEKPAVYRPGKYTSVAIIKSVFLEKEDGLLDLENLLLKINKAEKLLELLCENS